MDLNDWIVVFDLDDTLFSEEEFVFSGILVVENFITEFYKIPFKGKITNAYKNGVKDIWGWSCKKLNLPINVKDSFLWIYRNHSPKLNLFPGISLLLFELNKLGAKIAILTDGRSTTQRSKLSALELDNFPHYISEEYDSCKPDLKRFLMIEKRWEGYNYVYVADNSKKDFIAPNQLGWISLGADWCKNKIHECKIEEKMQPEIWIKDPIDVLRILKSKKLKLK